MKEYTAAVDNFSNFKQTVEYTLQYEQYIGKFRTTVGGNARGRDILTAWDFENCLLSDDADSVDFEYEENEVDGKDFITAVLVDPATGETCEVEDNAEAFNEYIVKAEIIEAVKK